MILVESSIGSRELLSTLRNYGADAELAPRIDADFQFDGLGPDGSVLVGIERKTIQDLLNSMRDRRLAGFQIGRMIRTFDICYLVVEGYWRRGRGSGLVEIRNGDWRVSRGSHRYSELTRFLASLRELGGVRVWRTSDTEETAAFVAEEWAWWQKPWEAHRTGHAIYSPEPGTRQKGHRARVFRHETTVLERWLCALPGIDERAEDLSVHFEGPRDMANAGVERWMAIKGIGRKTAERIEEAISGTINS